MVIIGAVQEIINIIGITTYIEQPRFKYNCLGECSTHC